MTIRVRYFARLRDLMGTSEELVEPGPGPGDGPADAAALIEALAARRPDAAEALRHGSVRVEVNGVIGARSAKVKDGDEVALLPPFSGG
jgi:molybdopterin converting factor small subunit